MSAFRASGFLIDRGLWLDRAEPCPSPASVQNILTFPEETGVSKALQSEPLDTIVDLNAELSILLIVNAYVTLCSTTRSSKMFLYRTHNDTHQRLGFMFFNVLVTRAQSCSWSVGVSFSPSRSVIYYVFVHHPVGILSKQFLQFSLQTHSINFL